jgi:hypothetical protein
VMQQLKQLQQLGTTATTAMTSRLVVAVVVTPRNLQRLDQTTGGDKGLSQVANQSRFAPVMAQQDDSRKGDE